MVGLIARIAVDLNILLEDGGMTGRTPGRTAGRIMEVTVDLVVVFVVAVVLAKYGRTDGTCKVVWVVLFVWITISD